MRREGLGVFPGKNQSCSPCRETHRTGGNYANYDAMHIYAHPLDEALGRERTSTSALWAGRHPEPVGLHDGRVHSGSRSDVLHGCLIRL